MNRLLSLPLALILAACSVPAPLSSPTLTSRPEPRPVSLPTETGTVIPALLEQTTSSDQPTLSPTLAVEETTQSPIPPTQTPTTTPTPQSEESIPTNTSIPEISSQAQEQVYYVAPNGNDNYPGTQMQPFRTISAGVNVLVPGDTLYVRAGTYHEIFDVRASGTPNERITISAYPGEQPIIDGQNTLPGDYLGYMVTLRGDHITLDGFEVKNVYGAAVAILGNYNVVQNSRIHHCLNKGILVGSGNHCSEGTHNTGNIVENNEIWMTSLIHEGVNRDGKWAGAITAARCPQNTVIRGNVVHETWGLGIQAFEAFNTTIEDNVVWNNQMSHYYVNNAPYTLLQRNVSYDTADTVFLYKDHPGAGYVLADERPEPLSHHVTIVNNLMFGSNRGFYFFNQQSGSGMKYVLVAHNTFVNSWSAGLAINEGDHENSRIWNNIIVQSGSPALTPDDTNLEFSHNLWSEPPPSCPIPQQLTRAPRWQR